MQSSKMLPELLRHRDEFRLLLHGKLSKKDGWKNVREHQTVQLFGAKVLGKLLGLSEEDQKKFETVALVHDWKKRLGKFEIHDYKVFSEVDRKKAEDALQKVKPDPDLMAATGPEFLEMYLDGKSTFLQRIQFYLDDITSGSEIVRFDARIDEVERRNNNSDNPLNYNDELTLKLGGKYWDVERRIGHEVEKEIFKILTGRGVDVASPLEIPDLIRNQVTNALNV